MRRVSMGGWVGLVVVGFSVSAAGAQQAAVPLDGMAPNRQVRVSYDCVDGVCLRAVGRLVQVTSDSVVVAAPNRTTAVARARVERVEVQRARMNPVAKGALIGFGVGATAGLAGGAIFTQSGSLECEGDLGMSCGTFMAQTGFVGGGAGLVIGAIIGGATGGSGWTRVPLDSLTAPEPAGRGAVRAPR